MKQKLLSLFVLLMTAVTSAWADSNDRLYLEVSGTSATLKYGDPGDNPYHAGSSTWYNNETANVKGTIQTITVDATTCGSFNRTSLSFLFYGFTALTSVDLSGLNTSNVTEMISMFQGCEALQTVTLSGLNTSSLQNVGAMFWNCSSLETLDFSSWNTSSLTDMGGMLKGCSQLQTVNFSGWDTGNVTRMNNIFNACTSLQTLDISNFNTGKVTTMEYMFLDCTNLKTIYVGAGWDVTSVNNSTLMFLNCTNLPNWNSSYKDQTKAYVGADGYLTAATVNLTAHEGATGEYWTTFYSTVTNYKSSAQVFKVKLTGSAITMTEIADGIVNSGEGVVLKSTSATITMTPSNGASAGDYSENSLTGTMINITNPGDAYVLNKKSSGIGFYKLKDTGTIGANKSYLTYSGTLAREFFGFDETTDISAPLVNSEKVNSEVFDLQGRRISQPTKGLYIVNGKKVFINK